jgi:hypothetical protein
MYNCLVSETGSVQTKVFDLPSKGFVKQICRDGSKPVQNAFVEGFNGRQQHECLNEEIFDNLAVA